MSSLKKAAARALPLWLLLICQLLLAACATAPKPVTCPLPGKEIDTLQSPISMSVKAGDKTVGGRGYLIYKRPDRFHLVILSPFGLTLLEVYTNGDDITCVVPSKDTAFTGKTTELPDENALRSWALMRWVADRPPAAGPLPGSRECLTHDGRREMVFYDKFGLVTKKVNDEGDQVLYRDYADVNGTAVPRTVELTNQRGDAVRIVFEEPEVNQPTDEAALSPNLEGLTVLHLSAFTGM
ncbi:MAG TPA: outer membrane lipoprotein LolB [Geobacteraceae bacterium]